DSDDLHPWPAGASPDVPAQRRLAGERGARECLVDDGDPWPVRRIGAVEITAGAKRYLQRLEIAGRDGVELGGRPLPWLPLGPALDEVLAGRPALPAHREEGHA